eukprot:52118-Pleurochrysis_carterae.AAC.2
MAHRLAQLLPTAVAKLGRHAHEPPVVVLRKGLAPATRAVVDAQAHPRILRPAHLLGERISNLRDALRHARAHAQSLACTR